MPHELLYTSAPRGLKPGSSGFCTLAQTPDLPKDLASQLEGISHYRHLRVDDASGNPVAFSHSILTVGYGVHHVLSRIADSGLDHSGRSNFLAHHVCFDPEQLPDAGPAWLCEQRLFYQKWDRGAGLLPAERAMPTGRSEPRVCKQWMKLAGDAGWAGVLAAATNAAEPAYIVYEAGQEVLPLLEEAMALLPPEARWNVTFNTYFTGKAVRTTCQWRCVTADSPEARDAIAARRGVVLRIDQPMSGVPSGPLVEAARTGHVDRPAPRHRTVEPGPRPIEVNELPESEPAMPASRPIRTRSPEPDVADSAYDMPLPAARRSSSGKGATGALILGMLLGTLLMLAAVSLVELNSKDWLFAKLGQKSKPAEQLDDANGKISGLESDLSLEKTRTTSLRNDRAADALALSDMTKKRDDAKKEAEDLQAKLNAANAKPPVVIEKMVPSAGLGFFGRVREAQIREANFQKRVQAALDARPPRAGAAVQISTVIPEKWIPTSTLLPGLKVADPAKARLDVLGFLDNITFPWDPGMRVSSIREPNFSLNFKIRGDGIVESDFAESRMDLPNVGHCILRVDHGDGRVEYIQFFRREVADANKLTESRRKEDPGIFTIERYLLKSPEKLGKLAPRNARVKIGSEIYHLDVVKQGMIENRAGPDGTSIRMRVENYKVIVEVKGRDAGGLAIEQLEIVRLIAPVEKVGFPGCEQELIRFYPFTNKK